MESKHAPAPSKSEFAASLAALPPATQLFELTVPVRVRRPRQQPEGAPPVEGDAPPAALEELVMQLKIAASLFSASERDGVPSLELLLTDDENPCFYYSARLSPPDY